MPKKKSTKPTLVNFILDESGSMSSITDSVISGFNEYVDSLKKAGNYKFTLTKFDSTGLRTPYIAIDVKDVKPLDNTSYQPGALTPLYDAVCETILEVEKDVDKDQSALVAIMTDGQENASKEYTQSQLQEMIKRLEKEGNWTFVFLGANQDSWAVAQQIGIPRGNVSNWQATPLGTQSAFMTMSTSTAAFNMSSGGGGSTTDFFSASSPNIINNAAKTLGSLGGTTTANTHGSDFYRKIGELGRQSRHKNK